MRKSRKQRPRIQQSRKRKLKMRKSKIQQSRMRLQSKIRQSERENRAKECRDLIHAIKSQDEDYINKLTTINFDINETHPDFGNPLHKAARVGNFKIFKKLIELGADIHQPTPATELPLLYQPVISGNCDIIKYMIENGIDVNARYDMLTIDFDNITLLHHAVRCAKKEIIPLLIDNNADINSKSTKGKTPLSFAILGNRYDTMDALIKYEPDLFCQITEDTDTLTNFHLAMWVDNWKMLYEWLFKFADTIDVNNNNINLFTFFESQLLLHYALSLDYCSTKVIDYLLDVGLDVNALDSNNELAIESKKGLKCKPHIIYTVKLHIVKLIAAGFYVCDRNIEAVHMERFGGFFSYCQSEVEKMKKHRIEGSNITLLEFLRKNIYYSAHYLKSVDLINIIERDPSEPLFPDIIIYDDMLFYKLQRAFQRVECIKDSEEIIYNIFNELHLPHTFVRKLYLYLSNNDLEKIIQRKKKKNLIIRGAWDRPGQRVAPISRYLKMLSDNGF